MFIVFSEKTAAAKPVQPTVFTAKINAVQPSFLSPSINIERFSGDKISTKNLNSIQTFPLPPTPTVTPIDANKENKFKAPNTAEEAIESWLMQVREFLKNPDVNPIEFINDFKLQLYQKEIYIFTPKGELKILQKTLN